MNNASQNACSYWLGARYQRVIQFEFQYFKLLWKILIMMTPWKTQHSTNQHTWKPHIKWNHHCSCWWLGLEPFSHHHPQWQPLFRSSGYTQRNCNIFITIKPVSNSKSAYAAKRNNFLVIQSFYLNIFITVIYKTFFFLSLYHTKLGKGHRLFHVSNPRIAISIIRLPGISKQLFYL